MRTNKKDGFLALICTPSLELFISITRTVLFWETARYISSLFNPDKNPKQTYVCPKCSSHSKPFIMRFADPIGELYFLHISPQCAEEWTYMSFHELSKRFRSVPSQLHASTY